MKIKDLKKDVKKAIKKQSEIILSLSGNDNPQTKHQHAEITGMIVVLEAVLEAIEGNPVLLNTLN